MAVPTKNLKKGDEATFLCMLSVEVARDSFSLFLCGAICGKTWRINHISSTNKDTFVQLVIRPGIKIGVSMAM